MPQQTKDSIKQNHQNGNEMKHNKQKVEKEKKAILLPVGQENVATLPTRKEPRQTK